MKDVDVYMNDKIGGRWSIEKKTCVIEKGYWSHMQLLKCKG